MKELKALFGNMYPDNINYLKFRNFYRFYLIIYMLLFTSYLTFSQKNNMKEIKIGSSIPAFTLPDQNGNLFDINSVLGKKNLVIYFYPKDDSHGCTAQACSVGQEKIGHIFLSAGRKPELHKRSMLFQGSL
jgi:peroxiredoxin Q/BCP